MRELLIILGWTMLWALLVRFLATRAEARR